MFFFIFYYQYVDTSLYMTGGHSCFVAVCRYRLYEFYTHPRSPAKSIKQEALSHIGRLHCGYVTLCTISGFHHKVDENCAVLGYYAVSSGNFLLMFCAETLVRNYHYFLCNNPEECSSRVIV